MALDTTTEVQSIASAEDSWGDSVKVANADFVHAADDDLDIQTTQEVDIAAPDKSTEVVVHVDDADASFHVEVQFHEESDFSGGYTQRDNDNRTEYSGDATTDVYVTVAVASPNIRVRFVDDSGGANTVDYNVYVR